MAKMESESDTTGVVSGAVMVCPPQELSVDEPRTIIFLAGGITNCPDWQSVLYKRLQTTEVAFLNPRRLNFDVSDSMMSVHQIDWEYKYLRRASAIVFWFPGGQSVCPITLFELGYWLNHYPQKQLFIGCDAAYTRAFDVRIQCGLRHRDLPIYDSLDEVQGAVTHWLDSKIIKITIL